MFLEAYKGIRIHRVVRGCFSAEENSLPQRQSDGRHAAGDKKSYGEKSGSLVNIGRSLEKHCHKPQGSGMPIVEIMLALPSTKAPIIDPKPEAPPEGQDPGSFTDP